MPIDASIFALIENDSSLSGIYDLEGNWFIHTVGYLNEYLNILSKSEAIPNEYKALQKKLQYLVRIEQRIHAFINQTEYASELNQLVTEIIRDITDMPEASTLLLPGGWYNNDGGHSVIYQFTRHAEGYHFTVFNAGDGIEYHAKKSSPEKELYNPAKTWHIPAPQTKEEKQELLFFIVRLLKAKLVHGSQQRKKPIDGTVFYEELLPTISHVGGIEIKEECTPDYAYTGGQLSGTCSQRSIHQMLKINARSLKDYQRFIFKFKVHALLDYSQQCFSGALPFNAAVAEQIRIAIENNFKILNTSGLFSTTEHTKYFEQLTQVQTRLRSCSFIIPPHKKPAKKTTHTLTVVTPSLTTIHAPTNTIDTTAAAVPMQLDGGKNMLHNLKKAIASIQNTQDEAAQFYALQQIFLALPLDTQFLSGSGFYSDLRTLDDFKEFQFCINNLQSLLLKLEKSWLREEQVPLMNLMLYCVMSLHSDVYAIAPERSTLPSFLPFSSAIMRSLLGNQKRNAFHATNHPGFDKKFQELQQKYQAAYQPYLPEYYKYYNDILETEPKLKNELTALYRKQFKANNTELHSEIRAHHLEAVFMIAEHYNDRISLPPHFHPLITRVKTHLAHEERLRELINPLYVDKWKPQFSVAINHNQFRINTGLFPTFVPDQTLLKTLPASKYALKDSAARHALEADISDKSDYQSIITPKTANAIQLHPTQALDKNEDPRQVTQEDIVARDYFHLRSVPDLQIALTIDYFTRHIERCADESNQRYIEANLFQPGLLLKALEHPEFQEQFNTFIQTGLRYFTQHGQHTRQSLFFVRLNYLVARYAYLNNNPTAKSHMDSAHHDLKKQLSLSNPPEIAYVLHQYYLLGLIERLSQEGHSEELFIQAYNSYCYIQGHTNPQILEDKAHRVHVECALAQFKTLIAQQSTNTIDALLEQVMGTLENKFSQEFTISGSSPIYTIQSTRSLIHYEFNLMTGKLYEHGLAHHEVPLRIQHHPLMKRLGLSSNSECLLSADETYLLLPEHEVTLFCDQDQLTVQKDWTTHGQKKRYELQALTADHEAQHANKNKIPVSADLPQILKEGSIDYWQCTHSAQEGLLVRNNKPIYAIRDKAIWALDEQGNETGYKLEDWHYPLMNQFESDEFLIKQNNGHSTQIYLPRYALKFIDDGTNIVYPETGEQVVNAPSPIHPQITGLFLTHQEQSRFLVPIARFYATEENAQASAFYPVVHDLDGTIANASLEEYWRTNPPVKKPLWSYKNSEHFISFQLQEGEPIAENTADALYLAYLYLNTNQTEKAWKILNECNTRLGGLTGTPQELQYIYWICKQLPHVLPSTQSIHEKNKAIRSTPPYVACQLKTMSLLCEYLKHHGTIELEQNNATQNANECYAQLEQKQIQHFVTKLPETIYNSFSRLQRMRRHLEHTYALSAQERTHLLHYYHDTQEQKNAPQGALGFEWLSLSLESLLAERDALLAQQIADNPLSNSDNDRLNLIEQHLKKLKPVIARSSTVELVTLDLSLPLKKALNQQELQPSTIAYLEQWQHRLPGDPVDQATRQKHINALSSAISEDDFILNFPAYLQQALIAERRSSLMSWVKQSIFLSAEERTDDLLRKKLMDFCSKTLIAARHVPLKKQDSNIPLLCNVLYRVLNNTSSAKDSFRLETLKLSTLIKKMSYLPVPSLQVYQAKDIHQHLLVTPEELIGQLGQRAQSNPIELPASTQSPLIQQTGIEASCGDKKKELLSFIAQYQKVQKTSEQQLKQLGSALNQKMQQTLIAEEQAGAVHFKLAEDKKALAASLLKNSALMQTLLTASTAAQNTSQKQREQAWTDALALANEGPEDPEKAKKWTIEQKASSRPILKKAELLSLYSRSDVAYYIEKTGLNAEKARRLHRLIHQALLHGIQSQTVARINRHLNKAQASNDVHATTHALDLLSREEIPGTHDASIMLLQHEEQILLHQRQVTALSSLLKQPKKNKGFHETIEKIIMGGGKSKVILPILAERKAQGHNLVVIEVPQALLATNHVDLNRSSQRLFGKRAYRFEFNRDSDSSPKHLEQIYHRLTEIMTTRSYMVTTGEAIQSLELKYIELLLSKKPHDQTWTQQVYWCDKINKLFRHHADCIIDEVHQGLSIKKQLNYTAGEAQPIAPSIIKNATGLFNLISQHVIEQAPSYPENYDWNSFKTELTHKLLYQTNSPLYNFVTQSTLRYGSTVKQELAAYLSNKTDVMPEAVLNASSEDQSALAFFKQQITVRLPQTLTQKLDKQYGASRREHLTAIEQTIAIPYAASNVPNERNRFANELEAINKTIQMMLIKGISKELLIERIIEWQSLAQQELLQTAGLTHIDETPTAQGFALLTSGLGLKLSQINSKNTQQIGELHGRLQFNRPLIFNLLSEFVLKQIQKNKSILPSDNFNHADQYRSLQGVSGTPPWNNTTCHHRLHYDKTTSIGTDGSIFEIIRSKKPAISGVDYRNAAQFVKTLLTNSQGAAETRAIIDIKGAFTGVSNLAVAQALAHHIKINTSAYKKALKHIIYFNEQQVLCAIATNKPHQPIVLGTSDTKVVNRILDSSPDERFTYFDQIHTTGTDITQAEDTHALVLVDDKTLLQECLQGCMRLRQLDLNQTLELIVPQRMAKTTLEDLYQKFKDNDERAVFNDAPSAAKGQMNNHIRRHFLSLIQDIPSEQAEKKAALIHHFKLFFEESTSLDLFALYGALHKKQETKKILSHYQEQLQEQWIRCLHAADLKPDEQDIETMSKDLEQIIAKALPFCLEEYNSSDDSFALEVEAQKEIPQEIETEVLSLEECYVTHPKEAQQYKWPHIKCEKFWLETQILIPLNKICAKKNEQLTLFSKELMVSKNYALTSAYQEQFINVFLKPVFLVWYQIDATGIHATIVTPQEAQELAQRISNVSSSWIATTNDTVVAGARPEGILNDTRYQSLREQVRFFNGEFTSLLNQETPLIWLQEDPERALAFFAERLAALRPGSTAGLQQLHNALTQGKAEGFAYIGARPFDDLTQIHWPALFPKTMASQTREYQKLAEAFVYLNHNWYDKAISLDDLQQQFNISINSLTYIDSHLSHLMLLKKLLMRLQDLPPQQAFLLNVPETEKKCLEDCLGMSTERLQELHGQPEDHENKLFILSIHALRILRLYPALKEYGRIIDQYFVTCVKQSHSKPLLLALLKTEGLSTPVLLTILEHPLADEEIVTRILKKRTDHAEDLLIALVSKCHTQEQIDLMMQQKLCHEGLLLELLKHPLLSKKHLIQMLSRTNKGASLHLISRHSLADEEVFTLILKNPNLSAEIVLSLLKERTFTQAQLLLTLQTPKTTSPQVLEHLLKQLDLNAESITALINCPHISPAMMKIIVNHTLFTQGIAVKIIEKNPTDPDLLAELLLKLMEQWNKNPSEEWNTCMDQLLIKIQKAGMATTIMPVIRQKQDQIDTILALKMMRHLGNASMDYLPISLMLRTANEQELDLLVSMNWTYSVNVLAELVDRVESSTQINTLLNRSEMTTEIADILFKKSQFNGAVHHWSWLKDSQLIQIMNTTTDYSCFQSALQHPLLSPTTRAHWLAQNIAQQKAKKQYCTNLQQIFMNALEALQVKAWAHALKAMDDPHYASAAQTAFELHQSLQKRAHNYFRNPSAHPDFQNECQQDIAQASPVLGTHRGYKQIILDIVNVLFALVGWLKNKDWRFFKANTDTMNIVDEVRDNLVQCP